MSRSRLGKLELSIMNAFWRLGAASVREIRESLPEAGRPAYTTVQTVVYRLEAKGALRRTKKIGNAYVFEAVLSEAAAGGRLVEDVLALFGGRAQPIVAHLIESGQLTLEDVDAARKTLREHARRRRDGEEPSE